MDFEVGFDFRGYYLELVKLVKKKNIPVLGAAIAMGDQSGTEARLLWILL